RGVRILQPSPVGDVDQYAALVLEANVDRATVAVDVAAELLPLDRAAAPAIGLELLDHAAEIAAQRQAVAARLTVVVPGAVDQHKHVGDVLLRMRLEMCRIIVADEAGKRAVLARIFAEDLRVGGGIRERRAYGAEGGDSEQRGNQSWHVGPHCLPPGR